MGKLIRGSQRYSMQRDTSTRCPEKHYCVSTCTLHSRELFCRNVSVEPEAISSCPQLPSFRQYDFLTFSIECESRRLPLVKRGELMPIALRFSSPAVADHGAGIPPYESIRLKIQTTNLIFRSVKFGLSHILPSLLLEFPKHCPGDFFLATTRSCRVGDAPPLYI